MEMMLSQLGSNGDWLSTLIWFGLFFVFILFGPRLMTTQTIFKLEKDVMELEKIASDTESTVIRFVSKAPKASLKESIRGFMEFFSVFPVSTDPYGVMKKLDLIVKQSDERFKWFANQIAPDKTEVEKANLKSALAGAITSYQIAKIVRHYLEIIKKYKIFQLAMIIQMQIPLIARMSKAAKSATEAFVQGVPIGDSVGPLVVAGFMKSRPKLFREEELAISKESIGGRNVWVAKALGPGATTGRPGKLIADFARKQRISRIITVDAALRLEGEKPGTIAEGVGVAMGGVGVERYEIENLAVARGLPLDAVAVKVNEEEALEPMKKEVLDAVPKAMEVVKATVARTRRGERILLIGVGNTCGVGNSVKEAGEAEKKARSYLKKAEKKKK